VHTLPHVLQRLSAVVQLQLMCLQLLKAFIITLSRCQSCISYCASKRTFAWLQGLLQLGFVFMQASTITMSMAVVQLLQAARR